jgi:hypothetical protein
VGSALFLASLWALIPAGLASAFLILRTHTQGKVHRQGQRKANQAALVDSFPWLILVVGAFCQPVPKLARILSEEPDQRSSIRTVNDNGP